MNNLQEQQLAKMQYLMNYGTKVNETKNVGSSNVEYSEKCADGNTYGILKECQKFYIKVAPPKDSKILAEDFDYIGGYMRKKDNEFESYASAYKHLGMKTKAINEECQRRDEVKAELERKSLTAQASWQNKETQETRALMEAMSFASEDFNRICENVENIKNKKSMKPIVETAYIPSEGKKTPEAPKKGSKTDSVDIVNKGSETYSEKGKYEANRDKAKGGSVKTPFNSKVSGVDKKLTSTANPKGGDGAVFTQKPVIGLKGVAMPPKGKVTESEVNAWVNIEDEDEKLNDVDYGSEIGSTYPYEVDVDNDREIISEKPNQCCGKCAGGNCDGDECVFEIELEECETKDWDEGVPADGELKYRGLPKDRHYNPNGSMGLGESRNIQGGKKNMTQNANFGKHPRYKKPFAKAKAGSNRGVNGEQDLFTNKIGSEASYGSKIGSGYPFTQVVESVTRKVMSKLGLGKTKKA